MGVSAGTHRRTEDVASRVATGLKEPVAIRAAGVRAPIETILGEHVRMRWHERVMPEGSESAATIELVRILEGGRGVRLRESPPRWVRVRRSNHLYVTIGPDLALPLEPTEPGSETMIAVTCLTNPAAKDFLNLNRKPSAGRRSRARWHKNRRLEK